MNPPIIDEIFAWMLHSPVHGKREARTLDPRTQEEVRRRAVQMLQKGRTQQRVADEREVTRTRVNGGSKRFQEGGWEALRAQKQGPKTTSRKLTVGQEEEVQWLIADKTPDPSTTSSPLP